jgi:hypothetical protein
MARSATAPVSPPIAIPVRDILPWLLLLLITLNEADAFGLACIAYRNPKELARFHAPIHYPASWSYEGYPRRSASANNFMQDRGGG